VREHVFERRPDGALARRVLPPRRVDVAVWYALHRDALIAHPDLPEHVRRHLQSWNGEDDRPVRLDLTPDTDGDLNDSYVFEPDPKAPTWWQTALRLWNAACGRDARGMAKRGAR
jgi:hypothetical protein